MKNIVLLGSTGSVGKNVLDVVRHYPDKFKVKAIAGSENITSLLEQAEEFRPEVVSVLKEDLYSELQSKVPGGVKVTSGVSSIDELAQDKESDIIFMAISGIAALKPLVAALKAGKTVALASKEPIVSAGEVIKRIKDETGATILPVDSEHSAIMQCLAGKTADSVKTLYVTGTGGTLWSKRDKDFDMFSVEEVLKHPKWNMGKKITIDSATLMNKGLEVIEARWLFDVPGEKIKVVIHPEAIVHSMVEFIDGTISAGLFTPDMRFPILKALAHPDILESDFPRVDFSSFQNLSFDVPDVKKFPALAIAYRALSEGGTMPAVLNGSNETAVGLFLEGKIKFTDIVRIVDKIMGIHKNISDPSLEDIIQAEKWSTEEVLRFC